MKVEELIIDGFKSYATRTVISGWDSSFNCITGLNGSGKSNILDAICFVLGITTMSTVRAQNLQDLIYKRGQAGVTKASVTIVFDNSDKDNSPIGFEEHAKLSVTRQVVLGGTSRFLINGHRAQQISVQQLFQSVQLNIHNPNFLIMQGQITKVLNMKPAEILALIEEAAGTRMFEERREKAIKTMDKKQKKVEEIYGLLQEEIEPKLDTLRNEKSAFLEFQQSQTTLERLEKIVVAHEYVQASLGLEHSSQLHAEKLATFESLGEEIEIVSKEVEALESEYKELQTKRASQTVNGGRIKELEKELKDAKQALARLNASITLETTSAKSEQEQKTELENQLALLSNKVKESESTRNGVLKDYEEHKAILTELSDKMSKEEDLLQSLQTGVSSKAGQEGGYASQVNEVRDKVNKMVTEIQQSQLRIEHLEGQISNNAKNVKKAMAENADKLKTLDAKRHEYEQKQAQLERSGIKPGHLENLRAQEDDLSKQQRSLQDRLDSLKRKVSGIDFEYTPPGKDFDPKSVKGLVAQLFSIDESQYDHATALEVCAGGRLYNVVVDTDINASKLLKEGNLKRRTTALPLNKIEPNILPSQKVTAAKRLAPNKVNLALDLVQYDEEYRRAIQYVFGNTLICEDAESAQQVTFNQSVRAKSVTVEGDIYDPNGTLSGGSRNNNKGNDLLVLLQKYNKLNRQFEEVSAHLNEVREQIAAEMSLMTQFKGLKKDVDLLEHTIKSLQNDIDNGPSGSTLAKHQSHIEEIERLKKEMESSLSEQRKGELQLKHLEKEMNEFNANKSSKLDQLKGSLKETKIALERQTALVAEKDKLYQSVQMGSSVIEDEAKSLEQQIEERASSLQQHAQTLEELTAQHKSLELAIKQKQGELEEESATLAGLDDELQSIGQTVNSKKKALTEDKLSRQKLEHVVEKTTQDVSKWRAVLESLVTKHTWISETSHMFGQPGTPFSFEGVNINENKTQLARLQDRVQTMKRSINPKVMNMIENVEKKEASLRGMISTIEKDKRKIQETITTLNEYKRQALVKTWEKVSVDFGKIFSDLLPGGFAKLVEIEGTDITEGLEVKVSLGNVWKEGLTELSGGQRSLIALSLILALLQFKPAPMYILDEVDAALDLHHTQNIGHIIKTRFKGSQFIVVSLKEGMFTNANRLFRTRFQEGTSTVTAV